MALGKLTKLCASAVALCAIMIGPAIADPPSDAEALHVLNRLGYGPAPGDLAHVRQIGIDRYIDEQLHPDRLPVPPALRQQLDALGSTHLSQRDLISQYREAAQSAKNDNEDGKATRRELYQRVTLESGEERLLSATESPRQLQEVMVDFWFNHFNVYNGKGLDRVLVENYEREAIRPYAMGRFRELLGATAHHPAMLFYLDNWLSTAPGYQPQRGAGPLAKFSGLNENYARELMELHTLGVDGGYTQKDVTELARMLTGWTLNPRSGGGDSVFAFDARRHDNGDKEWLGRHVAGRGQAEGEWALGVLASHPATAQHLAYELAQYFVADAPPPALVDRLSRRFLDTGGDVGAVLKALFDSTEFRDPKFRGAKFKTPYQYLVSSVRASNLPVINVRPLLATLYKLGMPLYGCQTPDGYKNTEDAWLNPDAVTRRINFATAFASGKLPFARPMKAADTGGAAVQALQRAADKGPDTKFNPAWTTPPVDADLLLSTLGESVSTKTRTAVAQSDPALRAALVLGSPDFMHR
jgi:uncharacterized protein (DUF1800 family)